MSETDLGQFREVAPEGRFTQQNSSLLKVRLDGDEVRAKLGSMVAYQGDVRFEPRDGGVRTRVKSDMSFKTFTGRGSGETFQISFKEEGWVLVQSSEGSTVPAHSHGSSQSVWHAGPRPQLRVSGACT